MITTITRRGRDWAWPEYDTELIKVFDQVDDIDTILPYVEKRGVCVQAGGACGVWPYYLSQHFAEVVTFEPDPLNFECLVKNAPDAECYLAALGLNRGWCRIDRDNSEATNAGAGYVRSGGDVPVIPLDDMDLEHCDLLCLDAEGSEADILLGAFRLLRSRPVVVIEEKPLPQNPDYTRARRLLERAGYKERARFHRDVLFTC